MTRSTAATLTLGITMSVAVALGTAQAQAPAPAQTAPAQTTPAGTPVGGFNLNNASLLEVIDTLARELKINYVLDATVKGGSVTVNTFGTIRDVDLRPLFETILRMNNLAMVQAGMNSTGFRGLWISSQELRIRHFHKTVDDYVYRNPIKWLK